MQLQCEKYSKTFAICALICHRALCGSRMGNVERGCQRMPFGKPASSSVPSGNRRILQYAAALQESDQDQSTGITQFMQVLSTSGYGHAEDACLWDERPLTIDH